MLLCIRMVVIYDYIQILGTKYRYCIHVPFLPSILTSGLAVTSNKDWRFLISCIDPLDKYLNLHIKIVSLFNSHRRRFFPFTFDHCTVRLSSNYGFSLPTPLPSYPEPFWLSTVIDDKTIAQLYIAISIII